ncbi:hypothetical protein ACSV5M_03630 [Cellvibrio sp. ARAG 10.3]|uniref:hypothetical protein n=1 Tax=Cellvibrio sp. ARAG 10.3 TaxID=3451358 RepID=UPI003F46E616
MNLWIILIVIGVVAMVLGPIMMLQPNATQRSQEHLRRKAMEMGMRIRVVSLPQQKTDTEAPSAMPVYSLPDETPSKTQARPEWLLVRTPYAHEAHYMGSWQWYGNGRAAPAELGKLEKILPQLPASVHAVEAGVQGYGFYWSEAGGIARLETLFQLLQQLQLVRSN